MQLRPIADGTHACRCRRSALLLSVGCWVQAAPRAFCVAVAAMTTFCTASMPPWVSLLPLLTPGLPCPHAPPLPAAAGCAVQHA